MPIHVADITDDLYLQSLLTELGDKDKWITAQDVDSDGDGYLDQNNVTKKWGKNEFQIIRLGLFANGLISKLGAISESEEVLSSAPPLFDLNDKQTASIYEHLSMAQKPSVIDRDLTSFDQIYSVVKDAVSKHGNGGIVILTGAGVHIWGAIPKLAKEFNSSYIGFSLEPLRVGSVFFGEQASQTDVEVQMKRAIGVAKHLGFKNLEQFRKEMRKANADNIIIGFEETGLHGLYVTEENQKKEERYLAALEDVITRSRPSFVAVVGEDVYVEQVLKNIEGHPIGKEAELWAFVRRIHDDQHIPIIVGRFGAPGSPYKNSPNKALMGL